jgi:hypothetical protein
MKRLTAALLTVPTNPALGYPPGEPSVVTPGSVVHQVAGLFLFGGLSGAAFALAPRLREVVSAQLWATDRRDGLAPPIVGAPMAGRQSTPALAAAIRTSAASVFSQPATRPRTGGVAAVGLRHDMRSRWRTCWMSRGSWADPGVRAALGPEQLQVEVMSSIASTTRAPRTRQRMRNTPRAMSQRDQAM